LIVSPDNASREAINQAVRVKLQEKGTVAKNEPTFLILTPRSEMTGADGAWAQKYQPQDVLHYSRGSKEHHIERGSYATVIAVNAKGNLLTVQRDDGQLATYDPKRLQGITAYREREREVAPSDPIQFTAPDRNLHVAEPGAGHGPEDRRASTHREDGWGAGARPHLRRQPIAAHRSRLCGDLAQLARSHCRPRAHQMNTSTHTDLINTRFAYVSVARLAPRADLHQERRRVGPPPQLRCH
jgi:hypothetical protein